MSCRCIACEREGQGACGCMECGECGFASVRPLAWNDETMTHYCATCAPAKRVKLVEGTIGLRPGLTEVVRGGRWVPLKAKGRRKRAA